MALALGTGVEFLHLRLEPGIEPVVLDIERVLGRAMRQLQAGRRLAHLQQAGRELVAAAAAVHLRGEGQKRLQIAIREGQRAGIAEAAVQPLDPPFAARCSCRWSQSGR